MSNEQEASQPNLNEQTTNEADPSNNENTTLPTEAVASTAPTSPIDGSNVTQESIAQESPTSTAIEGSPLTTPSRIPIKLIILWGYFRNALVALVALPNRIINLLRRNPAPANTEVSSTQETAQENQESQYTEDAFPVGEKHKAFYEYSKEVMNESFNQGARLDQKASIYIAIITLVLGTDGLLLTWIFDNILPPDGYIAGLTLSFTGLSIIILSVALLLVLNSLRVKQINKPPLDDKMVKYFKQHRLFDFYYFMPEKIAEAVEKKNESNLGKGKTLDQAFKLLFCSVILTLLAFTLYGAYKWRNPKTQATKTMTDQNNKPTPQTNTVTPNPQPTPQTNNSTPSPQPSPTAQSQKSIQPNPNAQIPKFTPLLDEKQK